MSAWFPIADRQDAVPRHVARTALHGRELAVWRADDGFVNVWANRCLHRGVRLSIGSNDGAELVCRYHAWRYANRTGGCVYIPAHPADAPARTVHSTTYPAVERYGLIWTAVDGRRSEADVPTIEALDDDPFLLRPLPVRVAAPRVLDALRNDSGGGTVVTEVGHGALAIDAADGVGTVVYFVQPVDAVRSVIRPVRVGTPDDEMGTLRRHAQGLVRLVERLELDADTEPGSALIAPMSETPVSFDSETRSGLQSVRVARKHETAAGILAIDLMAAEDDVQLATFQPGDHIDVHLPGSLVRQYSLTNGPGETSRYRIGVKRAPDSAGGSRALHDEVEVGDTLLVSEPRHGFPLRRNVPKTMLVAGGIGITPILSMAQALDRMGLEFELHYFAGGEAEVAFTDVLGGLGPSVRTHLGLDPDGTQQVLAGLLAEPSADVQISACGPPPMLDLVRSLARDAGWPDASVAFEYFENTTDIDRSSSFTVDLARSAIEVSVEAGTSILDAVRAAGVRVESSCEHGTCGTCAATVLDGEPYHQDVFLNDQERAAGTTILTCVSRAHGDRLVLDL